MDRMSRLIEVIRKFIEGEFTGYIKINFTQGHIGRVEKFEELEDTVLPAESKETKTKEKEFHDVER